MGVKNPEKKALRNTRMTSFSQIDVTTIHTVYDMSHLVALQTISHKYYHHMKLDIISKYDMSYI